VSEKRQRTEVVAARLRPDEKTIINEAALASAITVGAFVRGAALKAARLVDVRDQKDDERDDG
jgi:uncharacterized protein (DUF1778 family)